MVFSLAAFLVAGLAVHNVVATPIPPPDCALDTPNSCTTDIYHHGGIPGNPLPPRDALPCPLEGDCGPLTVDPITLTATSTSSASLPSATTCTIHHGIIPIGSECIESGPNASQCISILCLDHPNTCGCPAAPPEPAQRKRSAASSSDCGLEGGCGSIVVPPLMLVSTSTSAASSPSPTTCTEPTGPPQLSDICFDEGPYCVNIECHEHPNTCGCPYAPPPAAASNEKRTVDPASASTSTAIPPSPTCTNYRGAVPIGEVCFESGPKAGTCTSILCEEHPDVCGCPGAPPPAPTQEKRAEDAPSNCGLEGGCTLIPVDPIVPTSTSTSSAPVPTATTCVVRDGGPIGSECFTSGPHAGECISILCLDHPDTGGCPGGDVGKRSESAPSKVQSERTYCELDGSGPPGCVCLNCEKEKRSESELIGEVCYENGTCTTLECLADPTSSPTCLPQSEKRSEAEPISVCFENGTCTTFECLNYPDSPTCLTQKEKRTVLPCAIGTICFENGTCTAFGCGDSPSPTTEKEKRSEGEQIKRDDSTYSPGHGGPGPVCGEPVCESCPDLAECASDVKRSPQEGCHYVPCAGGLVARSDEDGICLCDEPY